MNSPGGIQLKIAETTSPFSLLETLSTFNLSPDFVKVIRMTERLVGRTSGKQSKTKATLRTPSGATSACLEKIG
jgi:hypothetical protein